MSAFFPPRWLRKQTHGSGPWIGLTEALARAGRPSQKDFKLSCPRFCCTVPGRCHRTGPSGQRAIIQSVVTVRGVCPEQDRTHRITGASGPGVPVNYIYVYHVPFGTRKYLHEFMDINGYLHLDTLFKMWISISGYLGCSAAAAAVAVAVACNDPSVGLRSVQRV